MPGALIKERRKALGLSQTEMASLVHITQSAYSRIESRKSSLRIDVALQIAKVLKCPVTDFLPADTLIDNSHVLNEHDDLSQSALLVQLRRLIHDEFRTMNRRLEKTVAEAFAKTGAA